jgi:3-deoxy-manno-octulosonate cytidylyltransferase (CMP-KDO synthetase)
MNKVVIIIPARYSSSRLPGKPLLELGGKPIIQHVYENACASKFVDNVIVATDDERIYETVRSFGGKCVMTPKGIKSGSDRIAYVAKDIKSSLVMNLQGDEPFLKHHIFDKGLEVAISDNRIPVVTLATKIKSTEELEDPNNVKVVMDKYGYALYFSRFPIPFIRDNNDAFSNKKIYGHYRHIGVYIFRQKILQEFVRMKQSKLEKMEKLEQLRLLENGYKIKVVLTAGSPTGIDTIEDFKRAQLFFMRKKSYYEI